MTLPFLILGLALLFFQKDIPLFLTTLFEALVGILLSLVMEAVVLVRVVI